MVSISFFVPVCCSRCGLEIGQFGNMLSQAEKEKLVRRFERAHSERDCDRAKTAREQEVNPVSEMYRARHLELGIIKEEKAK
ncbi:MAG: hypothetical protein WC745_02505 [Patescibacteria group bacterium]|jgi:hypothetical protein